MAQFENEGNREIGRYPERSRFSGAARDLPHNRTRPAYFSPSTTYKSDSTRMIE